MKTATITYTDGRTLPSDHKMLGRLSCPGRCLTLQSHQMAYRCR
jgi:hypothetical protein